jgi:N-acyl amino acid synthase of PEP-CTERM/exosortase system
VCDHALFDDNTPDLPWETTAEISRFAVSKKATAQNFAMSNGMGHRVANISLGLMQAIIAMAARADVTHICAVMEPCLLRMLARLGIHFEPLGPQVAFHGMRQPCYSAIDKLVAHTWIERRDVWHLVTRNGTVWPLDHQVHSAAA